jgi:N-acetylated-alpha-linked acidic dipeptidase
MVSALNLKNEWEHALGLPTTGPLDALYEAGSSESQARVLSGMNKMGVWIDTVSDTSSRRTLQAKIRSTTPS